ncbi:PIN domain-containing protein [Rhizobium leguminosarum]|uniref:PIN domain-containing protein n=1 Tax=Rhizobium leguminosarum TaxID=384 RepID=UPI001C966BCA|nr:PIN domain-containing protein [Rhizobium leguminosarum]MBY5441783.1 type II toxin-antitoxin system VapC family toxin [Rhizobium leguminosarum]
MTGEMFLLDTNIISNSSKPRPHPAMAEWLIAQERVAIPFAALLEIETGIAQRAKDNLLAANQLWQWLDGIYETEFEYPPATPAVARVLGKMLCCRPLTHLWYPASQKRKPGQDLFIAATAVVFDLPIATADGSDFELIDRHFPLPGVFNPAFGIWAVPRMVTSAQTTTLQPQLHLSQAAF